MIAPHDRKFLLCAATEAVRWVKPIAAWMNARARLAAAKATLVQAES